MAGTTMDEPALAGSSDSVLVFAAVHGSESCASNALS